MDKFRILIVEDEQDVRTLERLSLVPKYEVVEACDGLDALDKLDRVEPDFVILDVMMPLMDGLETCRAIRKSSKYRDVPVLFVSAKKDRQSILEGYSSGANLYLTKPFDPVRLAKNIDMFFQENPREPRPKRLRVEEVLTPESPAFRRERGGSAAATETPPIAEPTPAPRLEQPVLPTRPRVMIVDDNEDLLEMLRISLVRDFEITTAVNGVEAVEKIIMYQPDLIVLDAMLPKMSGYQLCQSIRRNRNYTNTPIMFISAKASERDREYCFKLGANDFLAKPFDPERLRQRLLACASAPGFIVRPKQIPYSQIQRPADWGDRKESAQQGKPKKPDYQSFIDRQK